MGKMKSAVVNLTLCLALLSPAGTSYVLDRAGAGGKEKKVQYASWDDVNVIAHGLLQLGHGLKEHVDKTKSQMKDITTRLKEFNSTVAELGKQTQSLKEDGEVLMAKAQRLEQQENQILNISSDLHEKADELQAERLQVQERLGKLEEKVDGILQGEASNIYTQFQWMLEAQNRRIDELVERIRQQQDKLEKQNVRIRNLQNHVKQRKERSSLKRTEEEIALNISVEQSDSPIEMPLDCHKLFLSGEQTSGVYTIQPPNAQPFEVLCEIASEGGWTVIQRRHEGSLDFNQLWEAYKNGFGSLDGDFWLGLEKIHSLSKQGEYIMQVELSDWRGDVESIIYDFTLGGEESNYILHVKGRLSGSLGSALTSGPFSTQDRDNDERTDINCAKHLSGGWWFSNCGRSNLNGKYFGSPLPKQRHERKQGVYWKTQRGRYYPWKTTVIKIAPIEIHKKS